MRMQMWVIAAVVALGACSKADANASKENTAQNGNGGAGDPKGKTPLDQQENETDLTISQNVRKAVMGDSSLSMTAKNVKIITANGVVTLRGPVESEAEKATIASKAKETANVVKVDNQIEVSK